MTAHHLRPAALSTLAAVILLGGAGRAQTQTTTSPTPVIEQRFERPAPKPRSVVVDPRVERQVIEEKLRETERTFESRRPVVRLGQDYTLKEGDTVREVTSVFANLRIDGHVDGDAVAVLGSATIGSTAVIDGALVVVGGSATIMPGARINRDLVVVGGTVDAPPDFSPLGEHVVIGTPLIGDSLKAVLPWLTRGLLWGRLIVPGLRWIWVIVGIAFLVGFVLNHVFDRQVSSCAETLGRRPLSAFLMGLLVLMLCGPLLLILAATVIGLAVVPFAIVAIIVASIFGKIGVTRAIGRGVISEGDSDSRLPSWRSYVLGFALLTLAYMVPIIGLLTWTMVGVFGLGAATMSFAATLRRERPVPPATRPVEPPPFVPPPVATFESSVPTAPTAEISEPSEPLMSEGAMPPPFAAAAPKATFVAGASSDLSLYPRASFLDRVAAFALDVILIAIANGVLDLFWRGGGFLFLVFAYHVAFWAWKGTTLGGIICNLRVVRTNGANLRFIDALVRGLSSIFSIAALGIGCFWMLNDAERQMWHDKIAGTVVVRLPRELVLA